MEKVLKTWAAAAFLLILLSASLAFGQEARFMIDKEEAGRDAKYMSGGVGVGEREAMERMAQGYDLKLVFATVEGNYLSFVDVKITDQQGRPVITAESNGPWFYAALPPGSYQITATHDGKQKSHEVTLDGGRREVVLNWGQG